MIDPLKLALNPSEPLIPPGAPPPLHQLTPRLPAPVKLGPALDWSENDLSALAQVSSADITAAAALWRQDAPAALRDLLAAQVIE